MPCLVAHRYAIFLCSDVDDSLVGQLTTWEMVAFLFPELHQHSLVCQVVRGMTQSALYFTLFSGKAA